MGIPAGGAGVAFGGRGAAINAASRRTITLASSVSSTVSLADNNGQKIKATLAAGGSVVVTTNWAKPSTWVKVTGRSLAVTALSYK